jgi:hypothetical protein
MKEATIVTIPEIAEAKKIVKIITGLKLGSTAIFSVPIEQKVMDWVFRLLAGKSEMAWECETERIGFWDMLLRRKIPRTVSALRYR